LKIRESIRLYLEQDIPIPDLFREEIRLSNQRIAEGSIDGLPVDEKSLMKRQLKGLDYLATGKTSEA
jgi:hypothetical protein